MPGKLASSTWSCSSVADLASHDDVCALPLAGVGSGTDATDT